MKKIKINEKKNLPGQREFDKWKSTNLNTADLMRHELVKGDKVLKTMIEWLLEDAWEEAWTEGYASGVSSVPGGQSLKNKR